MQVQHLFFFLACLAVVLGIVFGSTTTTFLQTVVITFQDQLQHCITGLKQLGYTTSNIVMHYNNTSTSTKERHVITSQSDYTSFTQESSRYLKDLFAISL